MQVTPYSPHWYYDNTGDIAEGLVRSMCLAINKSAHHRPSSKLKARYHTGQVFISYRNESMLDTGLVGVIGILFALASVVTGSILTKRLVVP